MNSFLFKLKYVYRNITRNIFRTLALFLSILMLSFIVLTLFTVKDVLLTGFYAFEDVRNERVDIVITFDAKSDSYIINTSKLKTIRNNFDYYGAFFELETLTEHQDTQLSSTVMAGAAEELGNFIQQELEHLQYNQVIINEKTAEELDVIVGDSLYIYIASIPYEFKVVNVVKQSSIFEGNKILVQKEFFVKEYAKIALDMNIDDFSEIDLATTVYLNLKDDIKKEDIIALLKTDEFFPNSVVRDPRNYNEMMADIEMGTGIMYAALIIFIAALLFVMVSIINLRVRTFKNEVGILETLGENKVYIFKLLMIEIGILATISLFLAYLANSYIYTKEFSIISNKGSFLYDYKWYQFIGTYLTVLFFSFLTLWVGYRKYKKMETMELAENKQYEYVMSFKSLIVLNIIFFGLNIVNKFIIKDAFPILVSSITGIICSVCLGIGIVSLIIKLVCLLFMHNKAFKMTFLRNLSVNKIKHNSIKILLVCLFGIVMCCIVIENIELTINSIEENLNIDNIFISPKGVDDEQINEFNNYDAVLTATGGCFEDMVTTADGEISFFMTFSCDVEKTKQLMNFEIDSKLVNEFKNPNKRYIVVMDDFLIATNKKVGDELIISLSDGDYTYEILCGSDLPFQQFAYTNDYYQKDAFLNTILIDNDTENVESMNEFRKDVASKYGSDISFLYNAGSYIKEFFQRARVALDLVYVVITIIVFCFIVSIINNTILNFKEVQGELATLQILGISPMGLNKMIILEMIISYFSLFFPLLFMIITVGRQFGGLSLLCGYYLDLILNVKTIIFSLAIGIVCFIISYIYYFIGIHKINVCEELKK
ncbi:MAG: FtsX-like permease family protein [Bacilli bacterium]|nr:FtsX-like permease family protein [Bacilli bacterium]